MRPDEPSSATVTLVLTFPADARGEWTWTSRGWETVTAVPADAALQSYPPPTAVTWTEEPL